MDLPPLEQASTLLRQSNTPLIILPVDPTSDALAAGLALLIVLEKLGKAARIVSPNFTLPPGHDFLPKSNAVEQRLASLRNFIISVDVSRTKLESLSYDIRDNRLHIYLSPKHGFYEPADITTSPGNYAHDVVITLDLSNPEDLGDLYHDNAEFFYRTPVLNIDHHATNTRYGHINVVDVVASSVSEVVFELLRVLGFEHIDEQVATNLLTGIISKTRVFQNQKVTPRSLAVASHLMSAGARREEIIEHLYQTKTLPTLKLWGRALSRLQSSPDGQLVWTTITAEDLDNTKSRPDDAVGVMDELIVETPKAKTTCLFVSAPEGVIVHIMYQTTAPPTGLPTAIVPHGPQYLRGVMSESLEAVTTTVLQQLRSQPAT